MGVGLAVVTLHIALMQGVFSKDWGVTLPKSIMGINGSCITVPCLFEVPNEQDANILNCSNSVIWKKGSIFGPDVFTAHNPFTNTLPGQIVGNLTKKNCTTVFHNFPKNYSDMYFLRLDCKNPVKYTFSTGINIVAQPGLPPPTLTPVSQVSQGAQVRLKCSVPVPCSILPPSLTWFPRDNSRIEDTQMQQNENGQTTMTSTLIFTASADHHNRSITCSVSYPLTKGGSTEPSATTQRLNILYVPRFTAAELSTSGPLSEGRVVALTCSSDANPPVSSYTWYRIRPENLTKMGEGEILVLQVGQKDSGVYLCEAQNQMGSQRSRPVSLEVNITTGSSESVLMVPYIICGVVLVLYILTVVVDVYKYQSISMRLKQIELKGEHTYTDLRAYNVSPDYEKLQPRQPQAASPPEVPNYENMQKSSRKPVSKVSRSQSGPIKVM